MKMNVPTDLKYLNNSDKTCIEGVYVKKYTESMDSKIYTHLEENYDKYNGIKEFADKYSVSISAFKRKFNSFYSTTPAKWIRCPLLIYVLKINMG